MFFLASSLSALLIGAELPLVFETPPVLELVDDEVVVLLPDELLLEEVVELPLDELLEVVGEPEELEVVGEPEELEVVGEPEELEVVEEPLELLDDVVVELPLDEELLELEV